MIEGSIDLMPNSIVSNNTAACREVYHPYVIYPYKAAGDENNRKTNGGLIILFSEVK